MANHLFTDLREPLTRALERLCAKDENRLPYVFVEEVVQKNAGIQKAFVQWCTKDGKLLFDVPWANVVGEPMTIDASITRAIELLRGVGVCDDERVLVIEDDQKKPPRDGERLGVIFPEDFVVKKPA